MMEKFKAQATRFGAETLQENITKVDFSKRPFTLTTEGGKTIVTETVIISTGANAKLLGLPKEKELMSSGTGVSACATCDGAFYKGEEVVVVGGGDTAMEEALFLTRFASKVTLVHRREDFRASKVMLDRAKSNPKIAWELNAAVESIMTEKRKKGMFEKEWLTGVVLKSTNGGPSKTVACGGLFVAIGHEPNTKLFTEVLDHDDKGYLITQGKSTKTKIPGVFACGDVQDSYYRQAITAAGSGCSAAIDAERFLAEHE
jgi:thioredoxin reductase (NADPH)